MAPRPEKVVSSKAEVYDPCAFEGYKDQDEDVSHEPFKATMVWRNVFFFGSFHVASFYGLYLMVFKATWATWAFAWLLSVIGLMGITAGAHRLWTHRSYKAKFPLKVLLVIMNCVAYQNDIMEWARDHRTHHKFSETNADPHNYFRGFLFAHFGWLLMRKHPDVKTKGAKIDLSDLHNDPVLRFQRRHYHKLILFFCYGLPSVIPMLWEEKVYIAFFVCGMLRHTSNLHIAFSINSFAHKWGFRAYDKHISPRQNATASFFTLGEGWHNYHHIFPFDYRANEYSYAMNPTTAFIDFFCWLGWASDPKMAGPEAIMKKKLRSGE